MKNNDKRTAETASSRNSFAQIADRIPQAMFIVVPGVHFTTVKN